MRKLHKVSLTFILSFFVSVSLFSQNNFFSDAGQNRMVQTNGDRIVIPEKYRSSALNVQAMKDFLWSLPSERNIANRNQAPILELPMPDGSMAKFRVWESSIQEPGLEAKFPEIKTFAGQGIDDPYSTIRFDYSPYFGFRAQVRSSNGRYLIDPYARGDLNNYISYYARDYRSNIPFRCDVQDGPTDMSIQQRVNAGPCRGTELRTYRLAFAITGEFAMAVGGGIAGPTHAALITGVNRLTQVYEDELAIRLVLIADNNLIEYLNPITDPWSNDGSVSELNTITGVINTAVGVGNYDIGHLGCTASNAGVAGLGVVCGGSKGRGLTGGLNPVGDPYYIDYVAHEMGHQFNASHTFNSNSCASAGGSYEPGGGTTVMAYAGICSPSENIQPNSDAIFHALSFYQISNFVFTGGGSLCGVVTPTGNTLPMITAMNNNNVNIPISTPFTLTGSATDADGDAITYNWEGWDVGAAGSWTSAAFSTTRPLFRTRLSKTTGSRTFPDMRVIVANYPGVGAPSQMDGLRGETLPTVARVMKFRLTVRDNRAGGGGVVSGGDGCQGSFGAIFQVNAIATSGPFAVTVPNGGESYGGGTLQTVTWNVVGTDAAPINTANVRISLSTDGGLTYPTELLASTPNDGSETLTIPLITTSTARIKIEAIGNIFFDISNANFAITPPPVNFDLAAPAPAVSSCPAGASMSVSLGTISNGGFSNNITLSATGNPAGTTVSFSPNPVVPGNSSTVTLNGTNTLAAGSYTITVTGVAAAAPNRTRDITFTISPGAGPAITVHPSNQSVCATGTVSFNVTSPTATGFQWQVSTDGGTNYTNITNGGVYSGATSATLTITGATTGLNNNRYRVIASVLCGSTTSTAGILTVNTAPSITTHPQSITLCASGNHTFTAAATGSGLTYQWETSIPGCAGPWAAIPGATASSYTINGITAGMNNTAYRVVVSGTCTPPATSNCALLTVVTSVAVTTQPTDVTVCAGSNASFTVAGSGTGIIYQWQVSTDGGTNYSNVTDGGIYAGATTAVLTITGAPASISGYKFKALLSNATCTTPGTSNVATLTVNTLPAISANPQDATICLGSNTTFTSTASGTGITYQWQVSTDGGANYSNVANGGVYSGATTNTLAITGATAALNNNRYRLVVSGTCTPPATSSGALLTVINPVAITTQPANAQVCSGSNSSFTVATASTQPVTYQWQVSTVAVPAFTDIPSSNAPTYTVTNAVVAQSGNQYRVKVSNTTCTAQVTSNAAVLTVRQLPTVTLTASATSLLPGQTATLTAVPSASAGGTLSTVWLYNTNPVTNTGNTRAVNIEQVGTYQVRIQEVFAPDVNNPNSITCTNQSQPVIITAEVSSRLFIFPSPNDGQFTVSYYNAGGASSQRTVTIYDAHGAKVHHRAFPVTGAYTLLSVNIKPAARGVYFIVIGDAAGKRIAKGSVVVH